MNCEVFHLKELEVEHFQIREVVRCILHTIAFHRALGLVRPKDVDSELFDITYVCLSFYEIRNKQTAWFSNKVERLYWEQWFIYINVIPPKSSSNKSHHAKVSTVDSGDSLMDERNARHAALELALRDVLFQIVRFVNEKKDIDFAHRN